MCQRNRPLNYEDLHMLDRDDHRLNYYRLTGRFSMRLLVSEMISELRSATAYYALFIWDFIFFL